jgi:hypothetical protein
VDEGDVRGGWRGAGLLVVRVGLVAAAMAAPVAVGIAGQVHVTGIVPLTAALVVVVAPGMLTADLTRRTGAVRRHGGAARSVVVPRPGEDPGPVSRLAIRLLWCVAAAFWATLLLVGARTRWVGSRGATLWPTESVVLGLLLAVVVLTTADLLSDDDVADGPAPRR